LTAGAKKAETSPAQRTVIENLSRDCTDEGYECGVQEASPGNQAWYRTHCYPSDRRTRYLFIQVSSLFSYWQSAWAWASKRPRLLSTISCLHFSPNSPRPLCTSRGKNSLAPHHAAAPAQAQHSVSSRAAPHNSMAMR